jgi:pyrophosphatase PpaX
MSRLRWPTVIFDLDGTLVDTIGLIVASYQHAFATVLGHPWDEAEIKTWIGTSLIGAMRRVAPDHADEIFHHYTTWNEANTERLIRQYPGVNDLITDLVAAGAAIGVATSKRDEPAHLALRLAGLDDQIPLLVHHDTVDEHKPSPKPLQAALDLLHARPEHAVYVGDAAVDIEAARNAGMAGVAVTWGAGTREAIAAARPLVTCDTVAELRATLLPSRPVVGFVCVSNAGKSQMAEALLRQRVGDAVEIWSAGTKPSAKGPNQESAASVARLGADMSHATSKGIDPDLIGRTDHVIVLGRDAEVDLPPYAPGTLERWVTDEPSERGIEGAERMDLIRDDIARRVADLTGRLGATPLG